MIREQHRIVLSKEQLLRFDAVRHHAIGSDRAGAGQHDREDEAQRGHASVFSFRSSRLRRWSCRGARLPQMIPGNCAGKMPVATKTWMGVPTSTSAAGAQAREKACKINEWSGLPACRAHPPRTAATKVASNGPSKPCKFEAHDFEIGPGSVAHDESRWARDGDQGHLNRLGIAR